MTIQKHIERDALMAKLLGYGVALLFVYFAVDDPIKTDSSRWPWLIGAIISTGVGHLLSWAISRPEKLKP